VEKEQAPVLGGVIGGVAGGAIGKTDKQAREIDAFSSRC
jgi:hypothetical protein